MVLRAPCACQPRAGGAGPRHNARMEIRPGALRRPLASAQLRALDRRCTEEFGIPSLVLMEHAGMGATRELLDALARRGRPAAERIAVLAGGGNNGGDGLVVARLLAAAGREVRVVLLTAGDRLAGDARTELAIARRCGLAITAEPSVTELARELAACGVLVDALLGTGFEGVVREPCASWIRCVNAARARAAFVAALDLPSGLDADRGAGREACVRADLTLGFAAPKLAFELQACAEVLGEVVILPIGAPSGAAPPGER